MNWRLFIYSPLLFLCLFISLIHMKTIWKVLRILAFIFKVKRICLIKPVYKSDQHMFSKHWNFLTEPMKPGLFYKQRSCKVSHYFINWIPIFIKLFELPPCTTNLNFYLLQIVCIFSKGFDWCQHIPHSHQQKQSFLLILLFSFGWFMNLWM